MPKATYVYAACSKRRPSLPPIFRRWFESRGWEPRRHQLDLLAKAQEGRSVLLVAPTGAGKTLAGFLPTPRRAGGTRRQGAGKRAPHPLHLAPQGAGGRYRPQSRAPVQEMGLPVRVETRTGDTPAHKRARQIERPPDILLTTPEQLALLLAHREARSCSGACAGWCSTSCIRSSPRSAATSRSACAALRARRASPPSGCPRRCASRTICGAIWCRRGSLPRGGGRGPGPEAGVRPAALPRPLAASPGRGEGALADLVVVRGRRAAGHPHARGRRAAAAGGPLAALSMPAIYDLVRRHRTTLVFVNTRMQAEFVFQALWDLNDDGLAIALHHGSLDVGAAPPRRGGDGAGKLKAVVCTSTLDLGIDWGDVDLVVNVGAPKGASRIMQRIGRSNHRMDEPSKAYLVPANRFEILECRAALDAVHEAAQDTPDARIGALDVLCQHVLGMACAEPFDSRRSTRRCAPPRPTLARAGGLRGGRRLRGDRRLRAARLRALRQDREGQGRALARARRAGRAAIPAQCRHHRRGDHDQGAARPLGSRSKPGTVSRAAGGCSARSRSISPRP